MMHNKGIVLSLVKAAIITLLIFSCMPSSKADEVSTLSQKLKDEDPDVRAVEPLIAALKDKNADVRRRAAETLAEIGAPAVEPLLATLNDKDPNVRWWAEVTLEKIKARVIGR
ncbi:MAG: HEAT repeat domain-containing protein [Candidatus Brocadiales bacterium]